MRLTQSPQSAVTEALLPEQQQQKLNTVGENKKQQKHVRKRKTVSSAGFRCEGVNKHKHTGLKQRGRGHCGCYNVLLEEVFPVLQHSVSSESSNRHTTAVPLTVRGAFFLFLSLLYDIDLCHCNWITLVLCLVFSFFFRAAVLVSVLQSLFWLSVCLCVLVMHMQQLAHIENTNRS